MTKQFTQLFVEAHRGASGYCYQNTIASFDLAVEMSSDAIELDIRKTKDNKIICIHDPLYLDKHINDWIYEDLILETKKENFIPPKLEDVLKRYQGKIILDIEIKEMGYEKEIIDKILSVLSIDQFFIRSFHGESLKKIKEYNEKVYCILLIGEEHPKFGIFGRFYEVFPKKRALLAKCDAVSPNYKLLVLFYVKRMHRLGLPVFAWTVNDEKTIKKVMKKKVDGIVGNYPDIIRKLSR